MITIIAKNTVKEGCVEEFIKVAAPLIEGSQKEAGCQKYDLHQDIKNPCILTFIEHWDDEAAIEAHNNSEHYKKIVPLLGPLVEAPSEVNLYKLI